jgi:type II secretion system protein H
MIRQGALEDERGFTLAEMMITILIMGILAAIAIPTWWSMVESRRVDSATNQLAADLRQAHSKAINRLAPQTVALTAGNSEYTITGAADPLDLDDCDAEDVEMVRCNDEDVVVVNPGFPELSVAFCPDGSAEIPLNAPACDAAPPAGSATTITVGLPPNPLQEPNHTIQINHVTSRIRVVP